MAKIKELRQLTGLTQQAFANYLHIPKRTIENWDTETTKCPEYTAELIEYKLNKEGMLKGED